MLEHLNDYLVDGRFARHAGFITAPEPILFYKKGAWEQFSAWTMPLALQVHQSQLFIARYALEIDQVELSQDQTAISLTELCACRYWTRWCAIRRMVCALAGASRSPSPICKCATGRPTSPPPRPTPWVHFSLCPASNTPPSLL